MLKDMLITSSVQIWIQDTLHVMRRTVANMLRCVETKFLTPQWVKRITRKTWRIEKTVLILIVLLHGPGENSEKEKFLKKAKGFPLIGCKVSRHRLPLKYASSCWRVKSLLLSGSNQCIITTCWKLQYEQQIPCFISWSRTSTNCN